MIPESEVRDIATTLSVRLAHVEKDYVMGWLLWSISNDAALNQSLVLKGGNCLRKVYFSDTRFSDDLDFTALRIDAANVFKKKLNDVLARASTASGIKFVESSTIVSEKDTPDQESRALDARVYFRGFAGDSSLTMRVKLDVSEYERIVLPTVALPIIHEFSDRQLCVANVLSYSLEEVLAEKLRSWIQRTRSRDLFDVVRIVQSGRLSISKTQILSAFLAKTIFKGIPEAGRDELLSERKFQAIIPTWLETIVCPINAFIAAANAIQLFRDFINLLFGPAVLQTLRQTVRRQPASYSFRPDVREAIVSAGRERKLVRVRYKNIDRDVEPYSFRFRRASSGEGVEYFYGFDRTRGQTIKSFFLSEVQAATVLPNGFSPRFDVEF